MRYLMIVVLIMATSWQWCNLAQAEEVPIQREPSNQTEQYKPCGHGPTWLNQIDTSERETKGTPNLRYGGESISAETYAEILIKDCSKEVAKLSAVAQLADDPPVFKAIVAMSQKNLDYMKWWLQNRRTKKQDH